MGDQLTLKNNSGKKIVEVHDMHPTVRNIGDTTIELQAGNYLFISPTSSGYSIGSINVGTGGGTDDGDGAVS